MTPILELLPVLLQLDLVYVDPTSEMAPRKNGERSTGEGDLQMPSLSIHVALRTLVLSWIQGRRSYLSAKDSKYCLISAEPA
jgi:hypothetical protein